jgi:predicted nucleic acid-binding protein
VRAILDASVLVRAVVPGQAYHAEVREWLRGVTEPLAPHLLPFEVATAIRHLEFLGLVSPEAAEAALVEALRLRVNLRSSRELHLHALRLARELRVSRTRDVAYLALALRENCPLFTLDERFIRNAASRGYPVRHPVGDIV